MKDINEILDGVDTSMFDDIFDKYAVEAKERNDESSLPPLHENSVLQCPNLPKTDAIKFNVANDDYHKNDGFVSSSQLKTLQKSERHFVDYYDNKEETKSLNLGNIIHADIEQRAKTGKWFDIVTWHYKTKIELSDCIISCPESYQSIFDTYRSDFEKHPILSQLLKKAKCEVVFLDKERKLKVKLDMVVGYDNELHIFDPKTINSIEFFKRDVFKFGYDTSCGFYTDVVESITKRPIFFHFVFIDTKKGYTKLVQVSKNTLKQYQEKFLELYERSLQVDLLEPKGYEMEVL